MRALARSTTVPMVRVVLPETSWRCVKLASNTCTSTICPTPSSFPIFTAVSAEERSLFWKFCSFRILSMLARSISINPGRPASLAVRASVTRLSTKAIPPLARAAGPFASTIASRRAGCASAQQLLIRMSATGNTLRICISTSRGILPSTSVCLLCPRIQISRIDEALESKVFDDWESAKIDRAHDARRLKPERSSSHVAVLILSHKLRVNTRGQTEVASEPQALSSEASCLITDILFTKEDSRPPSQLIDLRRLLLPKQTPFPRQPTPPPFPYQLRVDRP